MAAPLFSVVVVTFNRDTYLLRMLEGLLEQPYAGPFELILVDNGSAVPVAETLAGTLAQFPVQPVLLRNERNVMSSTTWAAAVDRAHGEFVLLPGDDDIPRHNFLEEMSELASTGNGVTLISGGARHIDEHGRGLGISSRPPQFESRSEALGFLLCANPYTMPASGFRRDAVDIHSAPRTRFALDWWIWIQCWLSGQASVSRREIIDYRQHTGQEKVVFGTQIPRLEGARMLASIVGSDAFKDVLMSNTVPENEEFVNQLLMGMGPNHGDSRWGPLVQSMVADELRNVLSAELLTALYYQANGQAGLPASPGTISTCLGLPLSDNISSWAWSRVPVRGHLDSDCVHTRRWTEYLNIPDKRLADITVVLACDCSSSPDETPRVTATVRRNDEVCQRVNLGIEASESTAALLLDAIGRTTGREQGFDSLDTTTERWLRRLVRFRYSRLGRAASRLFTMVDTRGT